MSTGHSTISSPVFASNSVSTALPEYTTFSSRTSRNSSVAVNSTATSVTTPATAQFPIPETSIPVPSSASGGNYLKARGFVCYVILTWLLLGLQVIDIVQ